MPADLNVATSRQHFPDDLVGQLRQTPGRTPWSRLLLPLPTLPTSATNFPRGISRSRWSRAKGPDESSAFVGLIVSPRAAPESSERSCETHWNVTPDKCRARSRCGVIGCLRSMISASNTCTYQLEVKKKEPESTDRLQPLNSGLRVCQCRQRSGQKHQRLPQEIEERQRSEDDCLYSDERGIVSLRAMLTGSSVSCVDPYVTNDRTAASVGILNAIA